MRSFVIIKPDVTEPGIWIDKLSAIGQIEHVDFRILSAETVAALYPDHVNAWYWERHVEHMVSGPSWVIALDCPYESLMAIKTEARQGTENPRNRLHISDNPERDVALFWEPAECLITP